MKNGCGCPDRSVCNTGLDLIPGASDVLTLKKRAIVNRVLEVAYGPDEENLRVGKTRLIADVLAS